MRGCVDREEERDVWGLLGQRGEQRDGPPARVRAEVGVRLALGEQGLEDGAVAVVARPDRPVDGERGGAVDARRRGERQVGGLEAVLVGPERVDEEAPARAAGEDERLVQRGQRCELVRAADPHKKPDVEVCVETDERRDVLVVAGGVRRKR